ncbi:MAG: hypothetical protein PW792_00815 [Acidobacteriaceae bacterium]|nr:hypothetical protein [Acidobacteriaceae bacterium]
MTRPTFASRHRIFTAAAALALFAATPAARLHAQEEPHARQGGGMFAGMPRAQGELKAVDGKTLTLKAEDGSTTLVVTSDNTRILRSTPHAGGPGTGAPEYGGGEGRRGMGMGNMQTSTLADLKAGDGVMAVGQIDPSTKTLHAVAVIATDGATLAAMRANMGKTYITGKVTAIDLDNAKMTVHRTDGVSQTIGFDESTSFRRGGGRRMNLNNGNGAATPPPQQPGAESITLADIKIGDNIYGQGELKNGIFVPKELSVSTPGAHLHGAPVMPSSGNPPGPSDSK